MFKDCWHAMILEVKTEPANFSNLLELKSHETILKIVHSLQCKSTFETTQQTDCL